MGLALWGCALALRERAILLSVIQKWGFPVPLRKGRTFLVLGPPVPSDWGILCLRWDIHLGLHSRKGPFWLVLMTSPQQSPPLAVRSELKSHQAHDASDLTPVKFSRT